MRILTADLVFTGNSLPVRNGVIVMQEDGTILDIFDPVVPEVKEFLSKPGLPATEYFEGFICPGFINAHCHLELSHLKSKLTQKKGLPQFILEIISKRNEADHAEILQAIEQAEAEMTGNGIVAVGDILNTPDTLGAKKKQRLLYHNFVEVFDINPQRADDVFESGVKLSVQFGDVGGHDHVSIVPHAPYSVSLELLKKINTCAYENASLLSLHNQETAGENEMFRKGTGELLALMKAFGLTPGSRWPTGFSSMASTLVHLLKCHRILLVHNTFSSKEDVEWARQYSTQVWWCLCPNANLFIEDRLPDITMLAENVSDRLLVGTDSYASNDSLSILDELKTISKHFPDLSLHTIIQWSTKNGADFFGWNKLLGTIEQGKRPGLNHLKNVDVRHQKLTGGTVVSPIAAG